MMNLLKILIVDDDATVRIGLKTLIAWEQYGYRLVGEAANGQQAIEIVHREQPHYYYGHENACNGRTNPYQNAEK